MANGWFKCSITYESTLTNSRYYVFLADADNSISYTGDGTSGVYIFGANLSQTTYAPPYAYTNGATATVTADAISITDLQTNGILGATEWTIMMDIDTDIYDGSKCLSLRNTVGVEEIGIYNEGTGINVYFNDAAVYLGKNAGGLNRSRLLIRNSNKTFTVYYNGVNAGESTIVMSDQSIKTLLITLTTSNLITHKIIMFNIALPDAQCISLTTP